jgi:hypothetical protein
MVYVCEYTHIYTSTEMYVCMRVVNVYVCVHTDVHTRIKSKGIYQPENLMSNGSSRHDDAAQTSEHEGVQDF